MGTRQEQSRIAGQAGKELTVNEALQLLDSVTCAAVEGPPLSTPPSSPAVGAAYIVASGATGEWAAKADTLAAWTSGGWRHVTPFEGLTVVDRSTGLQRRYLSGAWQSGVVGHQQAAIGNPTGGTTTDAQARTAITAILGALRAHGLIAP